ncbi:uncharacterized protein ARMOST_11795 [Armillaria ostoyae]|uniref:TRP C-terminal domain-containing protein n=1 Tax=Armillaria ostoyae TaxID=47428 RepID=A0A284RI47_ARMOS|nr:uncharacterized protein ARMOST_11795 [Armillaria ostoyae]
MQSIWLYLLALIIVPYHGAQAHQPAELFDAFEAFLTGIIDHTTGKHTSVFAADCIGRINAMTIFRGADNNTEFIYGVPATLAKANSTQLIGYPTNVVVEALAIQLSVVSATALFSMYYATVSQVVPLQVDMWLHFNEDLQIDAYDFMPRRLDRFLASAALMLADQISLEMPLDDTDNATSIISQKVAEDVCTAALEYCSGNNQQYDSKNACVESSSSWDIDTHICRYMFKNMVQSKPDVHCASLGPNGGDCAVQAYAEATVEYPFVSSLFAPNVSIPSTAGLSEKTFEEIMKINMAIVYPATVAFYPIPTFIYMLILYICANCIEFVLLRYSKVFVQLSFENQRNTVTYVLNTFWTSVALALQLIASPTLGERYTSERVGEIRVAAMVISGLYVFELAYRKQMRLPLLIHHFSALFSIIFLQVMLQVSMHIEIICAGLLWLFQATTEQSIFIGLLLYRLKYPRRIVEPTLKFAAVQSFVCKTAFLVWLLVWWGLKLAKYHKDFDIAFSVILVLSCAVLMATQVQGSHAVWAIARNMSRERQRPTVIQESPVDLDKAFLLKRESGFSSMWSHSRRESERSLASDMAKPRDAAVNVQV